jgi:hypothetical protein
LEKTHLTEPGQKAVIAWDGTNETLVLSSSVSADSIDNLVWVVPLPSKRAPVVTAATLKPFGALTWLFASDALKVAADKDPITKALRSGGAVPEVSKISEEIVDIYDVTILEARSPGALTAWLTKHGYNVDPAIVQRLRSRPGDGPLYYIVNRMDLGAKHAQAISAVDQGFHEAWQEYVSLCAQVDAQAQALNRPERLLPGALHGLSWDPDAARLDEINSPMNPADLPILRSWDVGGGCAIVERYALPVSYSSPQDLQASRLWVLLRNGVPKLVLNRIDGKYLQDREIVAARYQGALQGTWDEPYSKDTIAEIGKLIRSHFGDGRGGSDVLFKDYWQKEQTYTVRIPGLRLAPRLQSLAYSLFGVPGVNPSGETTLEQRLSVLERGGSTSAGLHNQVEELQEELRKLKLGLATPLTIVFQPSAPMFPLRISGLGQGNTDIEVYVISDRASRDEHGTLVYDAAKPLDESARRYLDGLGTLSKDAMATRLTFKGRLEDLKDDAVFVPMDGKVGLGVQK